MKINSIKGMHDLLPSETKNWRQIESLLHNFFMIHGYDEIRTPIVENADLFNRVIGESTDIVNKEMYTWQDQGGDQVALRPELTASVVRSYIQHSMDKLNTVMMEISQKMYKTDEPQEPQSDVGDVEEAEFEEV